MYLAKNKITLFTVLLLTFTALQLTSSVTVSAVPIPAGCPGSTATGPKNTSICATIPRGCPGSTQLGPANTPPTNCPYAAPQAAPATPNPTPGPKPPAGTNQSTNTPTQTPTPQSSNSGINDICGDTKRQVKISVNIGCKGEGNPITDAAFAIIRFLSLGVGLVIVASLTFAGIQYSASRGDPKATAEAIDRIRSNVVAFLIFIFSFAILNYLIPAGFIGL